MKSRNREKTYKNRFNSQPSTMYNVRFDVFRFGLHILSVQFFVSFIYVAFMTCKVANCFTEKHKYNSFFCSRGRFELNDNRNEDRISKK